MKEIIRALALALNLPETEVSSTLLDGEKIKPEAEAWIKQKFSDHVTKITTDAEAKRVRDIEQQTGKVTKEVNQKWEAVIATSLGVDKSLKGDDLIKVIPETVEKIRTATDDETKIKSSPIFIKEVRDTEERVKKEYEEKVATKESELNTLKTSVEREKISNAVLSKSRQKIDELKLRDDIPKETVEALRKASETQLLSGNHYKLLENGELIVVNEKGEMLKDNLGHSITLDNLIKEAIKPLESLQKAGEDRGDGGKPGGTGGNGGAGGTGSSLDSFGITKPKNADEFRANTIPALVKLKDDGKISQELLSKLSNEAQEAVIAAGTAK